MRKGHIKYWSHRGQRGHPASVLTHLGASIVLPFFLIIIAVFAGTGVVLIPSPYALQASALLGGLGASLLRLFGAYLLSLLIGIPLGLLAESNHRVESALLPIYDVLESMPVLAFFPVIILFFVHTGWLEGAAIFIIFFSMIWNITFNTIGGFKVIPQDVLAVGKVFGLSPLERFFKIILPALFPPLVTGSILALADGWNIVIVAEALHAYVPQTVSVHDLFGIGSILVQASASGNTQALLVAMTLLVFVIALINLAVWQPLLARAERYKFE